MTRHDHISRGNRPVCEFVWQWLRRTQFQRVMDDGSRRSFGLPGDMKQTMTAITPRSD